MVERERERERVGCWQSEREIGRFVELGSELELGRERKSEG